MNKGIQQNTQHYQYRNDEVSLVDLWKVIIRRKVTMFIVFVVIFFFVVLKTIMTSPIYESRSVIQIGKLDKVFIVEPELLAARLKEEYQVGEMLETHNTTPYVSSVSIDKKGLSTVLIIKVNDVSAEGASKYLKRVVNKILREHKIVFDENMDIRKNRLARIENNISDINTKISNLDVILKKGNATNQMQAATATYVKLLFIRDEIDELRKENQLSMLTLKETKLLREPILQAQKIKPKTTLNIILGLLIGLLVGVILAFIHEFIVNARNELSIDKTNR